MSAKEAVTLGPGAYDQMLAGVIESVSAAVLAGINVEELQMMDLSTAANFIGIPLDRAAKVLPFAEFGPRTRRVRISDYKLYQEAHVKYPKNWPPKAPAKQPLTVVTSHT